jgi:hypothetical protein
VARPMSHLCAFYDDLVEPGNADGGPGAPSDLAWGFLTIVLSKTLRPVQMDKTLTDQLDDEQAHQVRSERGRGRMKELHVRAALAGWSASIIAISGGHPRIVLLDVRNASTLMSGR